MGALAPITPWIPEDDILLKNAIEAGASLECLAKGAVQFSRRYTVRELQDRWYSLLYDPIVSEEASTFMIDFERHASILPSKFNKFGSSKETKSTTSKRKSSVRSCYYALRKKLCHEPFNPMDLSFLVGPGDSNYAVEEPISENRIPPISNGFGLQSSEMGIMPCNFTQNMMNNDDTEHTLHTECQHSVEKHFPTNLDDIHDGIPHVMEENLPLSSNGTQVQELAPSDGFPVDSLFQNSLGVITSSIYGQLNSDQGVIGSELEDNEVYNSPVSDSGVSFHNVGYSSPLPEMAIWRNASAPALPIDVGYTDKVMPTGDSFELPDDDGNNIQNTRLTGYDSQFDSKLKIEVQHDHLKTSTPTAEVYFADLLNLNNEEDNGLFMEVDGKDVIGKSFYDNLSSLLLNSPNEVNHDQTASATAGIAEASLPSDRIVDPPTTCSGELFDKGSHCRDGHLDCGSEVNPPASASVLSSQYPGKGDEPLFCTLNMEDPEIPSNDDVFLPPLSATSMGYHFHDRMAFSSVKDFSCKEKSGEMVQNLVQRERKNHGQPHFSPLSIGMRGLPEKGEKHMIGGAAVNLKLAHNNSIPVPSASIAGDSIYTSSVNVSGDAILPVGLKEESKEISRANNRGQKLSNSYVEKSGLDSDNLRRYPPSTASGIKQEPDMLTTVKDHRLIHAEAGCHGDYGTEQEAIPSTSDQEELSMESEDDVPHFSDVEAMILDMDLDPEDQDLFSSEEVLRYQLMDTKKKIIRLEQGAHAYMQRAIASHGALAVLYGRYTRHYIKKSEVLLGRATEDVIVDIDLGREGSGNKISRRQAIIKIDQDGSFSLKNLGKCLISINNKEVAPGHCLQLNTGCLIEIRGMSFIFESNPTRMKQYMDNIVKKSQKLEHQS